MLIKKICRLIVLLTCSMIALSSYAQQFRLPGQTLHIYTEFESIAGNPTWALIIRDPESGKVTPYIFDLREKNNFWIAFTGGHFYKIVGSRVKWNRYAEINNFCHLENGILSGKSMVITIKGQLSPNPRSFKCTVIKYDS